MADVITRLKVESSEYDSKIQRAAKGIQALADTCHKAGGELTHLEDENREYIQSLGNMETVARSARGKLNELTQAFTDIKTVYNSLSQNEKNSEFGKELNKQLEIMKGRIAESKKELNDISKELSNTTNAGSGTGSMLDQLTSKFGVSVNQLVGFGAAIGGAKVALDVAKDAFFNSETSLDEWGRTVQASESVYSSFLTALNNSDISGFLSRMDDIVSAARNAYNAMDELGTFSAFNQRNVAKSRAGYTQALDEYKLKPTAENKQKLDQANQQVMNDLRDSHQKTEDAYQAALRQIATERLADKGLQDAFVNMFSNGNYDDLRTAKASYKSGTGLNAGSQYYYGDRVYDGRIQDRSTGKWRDMSASEKQQFEFARALSQLNDSQIKEVQALGAQSQAIIDQIYQQDRAYNRLAGNNAGTKGNGSGGTSKQDQAAKAVSDAMLSYQQTIEKARMSLENGTATEADVKKKTLAAEEQLWTAYGKAYNTYADPKYKEAQADSAKKIQELGGEVTNLIEAQKAAKDAAAQMAAAYKKQADAADKMADAVLAGSTAADNNNLAGFYAANKQLKGMDAQTMDLPVNITLTDDNLEAFKTNLKEQISQTDAGTELYNKLTAQLADATALGTLLQTCVQNGIDSAQFDPQELWKKVFGENPGDYIKDDVWKSIFEQLNSQLKKQGLQPVNINYKTGGSDSKNNGEVSVTQQLGSVLGGVNSIVSGLNALGMEIPEEFSKVITGMQTVISITSSIASIVAAIQVISTANLFKLAGGGIIPAFANGGLIGNAAMGMTIPGNSFSGDNLRLPVDGGRGFIGVNSGELILNRSQQGVLADALQDNGKGIVMQPYVEGDKILLGVNNRLRSHGQGEIVTTSMLRRYGLIG